MTTKKLAYLGIDPGVKNLGYSLCIPISKVTGEEIDIRLGPEKSNILNWTGKVWVGEANTLCPDRASNVMWMIRDLICPDAYEPISVSVERFVSYAGCTPSITEQVLEIIGMIKYSSWIQGITPIAFRALDWKTELVTILNKEFGFNNPSEKGTLDKKFSMAAAKFLSTNPGTISNDHEADAVCLATIPIALSYASAKRKERQAAKQRPA